MEPLMVMSRADMVARPVEKKGNPASYFTIIHAERYPDNL